MGDSLRGASHARQPADPHRRVPRPPRHRDRSHDGGRAAGPLRATVRPRSTTESVPMDAAMRAQRPRVGRAGLPSVVHRDEVVPLRPVPREASALAKRTLIQSRRGRMRTCELWLRRSRPRGAAANCLERNRAGYGVRVGPSCGRFPGSYDVVDARWTRGTPCVSRLDRSSIRPSGSVATRYKR